MMALGGDMCGQYRVWRVCLFRLRTGSAGLLEDTKNVECLVMKCV